MAKTQVERISRQTQIKRGRQDKTRERHGTNDWKTKRYTVFPIILKAAKITG